MKKAKVSFVILGVVGALGMTPMAVWAGPAAAAQEEKPEKAKKAFDGKVEAVDTTQKTMTVGGNVIYISAVTKLTKNDKAITFSDIVVGEEVHGTTHQTYDGKTEALTVKVGPKPKEKGEEAK